MECPTGNVATPIADQLLSATQHLLRGATGKRQQQNRAGRNATLNQPRDAINQRASFAGARARDHQQWTLAMRHRRVLRGIQDLSVLDAEIALIGSERPPLAQNDYLIDHGEGNCTTTEPECAPDSATTRCRPGAGAGPPAGSARDH